MVLLLFSNTLLSQVAINSDGSTPDNSAMLEIKSSAKGFLPPRMTYEELNTIPFPADGLMVYCTDCQAGEGSIAIFIVDKWYLLTANCLHPVPPLTGTHVPYGNQIVWNWNPVTGATGYKWHTVNDFDNATDMGALTYKIETGLNCNQSYVRYAWAYNECGNSTPVSMTQSTVACPGCGTSITINHTAGNVAPVDKTVTYPIVTDIPGETAKCWISGNLGASSQATSVDDATEPSAGWVWQFNRMQGYRHDGITRTPSSWVSTIDEDSDWLSVNDPCMLQLGTGWRIPTSAEWQNVDAASGWTDWNGPWNSALKLHAGGYLGNGDLYNRGVDGYFWSGTQEVDSDGRDLHISSTASEISFNGKGHGFSVRCIRELCTAAPVPPAEGSHASSQTQVSWHWNNVSGAAGYKWNTVDDISTAFDLGTALTTTESGLACGTSYTRYVWCYNFCGYSNATSLTGSTASCLSPTFSSAYGGPGFDIGTSLVSTTDGGFAIGGYTESWGSGSNDQLLIKTTVSGGVTWAVTYGYSLSDNGQAARQRADGGYIQIGTSWQGTSTYYMYVNFINADGSLQTGGFFVPSNGNTAGYDVIQCSDGNFCTVGYADGIGAGSNDVYVKKFNGSGENIWGFTYGTTGSEVGRALVQRPDGGYIIVGYINSAGNTDAYYCPIGADGSQETSYAIGGAGIEEAKAVVKALDDGYVFTGQTSSFGAGSWDIYMSKQDGSGLGVWSHSFGGTDTDFGNDIIRTSDGGFAITGKTSSFGAGMSDIWLIKTDSLGNPEWSWVFGGPDSDEGHSLVQQTDGCFYIAGMTGSFGSNGDAILVKFAEDGSSCLGYSIGFNPGMILSSGEQGPFKAQRIEYFSHSTIVDEVKIVEALSLKVYDKYNPAAAQTRDFITPSVTPICNP